MKTKLILAFLILSAASLPAQTSHLGYCMNPSGTWIPLLSQGTATAYQAPATLLYGMNGYAQAPLQCDASGNLIVSPASVVAAIAGQAIAPASIPGASIPTSATNPVMDGTATPGVAATFSRSDHVHPTDTSRLPVVNPAATGVIQIAAIASPSAPTVTATCSGLCASAWTYEVVLNGAVGGTVTASSADGAANNALTLDATHYNTIHAPTCTAGAVSYSVYRTKVETSPATFGNITPTPVACGMNTVDNGVAGDGTTAPTANTTGGIFAPNMKATTNPYFVCVDTQGNIYSSATACYTPPS
jgi:hypothetical protein